MSKEKVAISVLKKLVDCGFESYFAGGYVRDLLRGVDPKDFDIATSATPEQVQKLFQKTVPVGIHFGVILVVEEGVTVEVATFRSDGPYKDGRHPTQVHFCNVEQDAKRRDFTVNGLYWDIHKNKVLDFVGGVDDLKKGVLRTIGRAEDRFNEDHLRMMRAVRFSAQLGFRLDPEVQLAIRKHAQDIQKVSMERIRDELSKALITARPRQAIEAMDDLGLLPYVLPELLRLKGVEQPIQYHPEGDVWVHTLMLLDGLKNGPVELAMGCLLHDIAKPDTFERAPDRIRFHGHDKLGAEKSYDILKRLMFTNEQIEIICALVAEHLRFKDASQMRLSTLKRFLSLPRFDLHLELHRLDCLASHGDLKMYEFCKAKKAEFDAQPPPPLRLVTGQDLIQLGFLPGPYFSEVLRSVEDAILEGKVADKAQGIEWINAHFDKDKRKT